MSISPLPGGIDDTAPKRDPFAGKSDEDLQGQIQRMQAELARREEEAKKPKFPIIWDDYQVGSTKDSRDHDAIQLNLPESCSDNFRYSGLEIYFRVEIQEDGTTTATHIRYPKTGAYVALPTPMKLV
jgi:hypothetical protein